MTEEQATAAVDSAVAAPAVDQPIPDAPVIDPAAQPVEVPLAAFGIETQTIGADAVGTIDAATLAPTIDTSVWNDAETAEPLLKGPCSPLVSIAKFGPAVSGDGHLYGWALDVVLEEEVDTNLGGKFPVGKSFNFLKVFTVPKDPNDVAKAKATKGRALKVVAALQGVAIEKTDSAPTILAKLKAAGKQPLPLPDDRDQSHYDQHVGKKVKVHLKPNGLDKNGYPQVDLQGMTAVVGAEPNAF